MKTAIRYYYDNGVNLEEVEYDRAVIEECGTSLFKGPKCIKDSKWLFPQEISGDFCHDRATAWRSFLHTFLSHVIYHYDMHDHSLLNDDQREWILNAHDDVFNYNIKFYEDSQLKLIQEMKS